MAFNVTVKGFGSFTATVNGEQAVLAAEVHDASALLATMAAQGPQGVPGADATISVGTTSTLPAGSSATVANSGTSSAAVFDFGIPQGIQGIQGIKGDKGDTGDSGVAYATSPLAYDAPTKTVSINSTSPEYGTLMASTLGLPTYAGSPQITVNTAGTNTILGRDSLYAKWFTGSEVADIIGLGSAAYAATSDFYASTNPSGYVDAAGALAAVPSATTTVEGKVELATDAEAIAGTDATRAVTPAAGKAATDGIVDAQRVDIQTFGGPSSSGSFTWTKPAGAKLVYVRMIGAGGGGASGACRATTSARSGGGGGSGGPAAMYFIPADELGATETVIVGAGGAGSAGSNVNGGGGATASSGGWTQFGKYRCFYGFGGAGATGGTGFTGTVFQILNSLAAGGGGVGAAGAGASGLGYTSGQFIGTGGGGGAGAAANVTTAVGGGNGGSRGISTVPASYTDTLAGGQQGTSGAAINGGNGTNQDVMFAAGTGGGGGAYATGVATGNGGNGGWPGGGGGGGAGSDAGFMSGTGGTGGNGMVTVITYF